MASIFTFDPDPPRVSSPWAAVTPPSADMPGDHPKALHAVQGLESGGLGTENHVSPRNSGLETADYSTITHLEAEPQEGPTEYKLHLLLRGRRSFTRMSTGKNGSGSLPRPEQSLPMSTGRNVLEPLLRSSTPPPLSTTQSRQHRLEQLTTQMLWRLQQSCTHHTSSATAKALHRVPDVAQLGAPITPKQLYPGLEESKGALYEIGVADDGELLGLAEDELDESLNNLRAMAASLGCRVVVQRLVPVGECEWVETEWIEHAKAFQNYIKTSKLLVAEALVCPDPHLVGQKSIADPDAKASHSRFGLDAMHRTNQLRVSLSGATMSGKSSLLGSLSTGTLDNGRGKSRLSLLKHRHEIESGVTSSITQELIGYRDLVGSEGRATSAQVINYGSPDISSWVDIHAAADSSENGRLVLLTDSAGHPRFRRTTVRGLIGWDPHYTILCIPADDTVSTSGQPGPPPATQEMSGESAVNPNLSQEQIQLCLSLGHPLLVVITKYDAATKVGLRVVVSKILSAIKEAGRTGKIITDTLTSNVDTQLEIISSEDLQRVSGIAQSLGAAPLSVVPIILTSAVSGTGLGNLHAFLRLLPIPLVSAPPDRGPAILFHIEDWYSKPGQKTKPGEPTIIGGHLRHGQISTGDELTLGPYPADASPEDSDSGSGRHSMHHSPIPTSRSFPGALHKRGATSPSRAALLSPFEWRRVRVTSIRNLRLPVRTLYGGQVGTIGIVPLGTPIASPGAIFRIRKGMVLADDNVLAHRAITVRFEDAQAQAAKHLSIGSTVVIFVASVRATAKVLSVASGSDMEAGTMHHRDDIGNEGFGFGFSLDEESTPDVLGDDEHDGEVTAVTAATFQFMATREFVEQGAKVLVMPGGGPGLTGATERGTKGVAGLEGFVGRVIDEQL